MKDALPFIGLVMIAGALFALVNFAGIALQNYKECGNLSYCTFKENTR